MCVMSRCIRCMVWCTCLLSIHVSRHIQIYMFRVYIYTCFIVWYTCILYMICVSCHDVYDASCDIHVYYIYMSHDIYIYTCFVYIHVSRQIDRKKPPPPGGVSIYYVPWSRAVCKRFHDEMRPSHLVMKSLTHGSWSGNIVNRKPPRGGGSFRSI